MKQTRYEIIQKPLLNLRDIQNLCGIGYKKAKEVEKLIAQDIAPQRLVNGLIPLQHVVRVMNIDVDLIIKLARS